MGTHISRVKSVDLDAWTDEQLRSVLMWGNARANKYWEAKLAPGHVPSEAKIENFIRTKYESKRWVMDGPIPDPATLDTSGDDDVPLSVVKEKQNIERSVSQRTTSSSSQATARSPQRTQHPDLFGDDPGLAARPSTSPPLPKPAPKAEPAPPKQTKPADSLLGLDFFGAPEPPPNRPASAAAAPTGQSRPDLKQSILSLYATAPKPQPQPPAQQPSHSSHGSFGNTQLPPTAQQSQPSFGRLNDAFSNLSFSSSTQPGIQPQNSKPSAFAGLGNMSSHRPTPPRSGSGSNFGGTGSFFDAKPTQTALPQQVQHSRTFSSSSGFGSFSSAPGISPQTPTQPASSSGLGDLFDFSTSPVSIAPKQTVTSPPPQHNSVFNLSAKPPLSPPQTKTSPALSGWNNTDPWGSNEAWSSAASRSTKVNSPVIGQLPPVRSGANDLGWGSGGPLANQSIVPGGIGGFKPAVSVPPKVSADEDFGGWSSAAPATPSSGVPPKKSGGFATSEDLFSNVWE
jgi:stromal membrane-associated protein